MRKKTLTPTLSEYREREKILDRSEGIIRRLPFADGAAVWVFTFFRSPHVA
jgi:hypothetical protein